MVNLFVFFCLYLNIIIPIQESILIYSKKIKNISDRDEKIAKEADELCSFMNEAMNLNQTIKILYAECESVVHTTQALAIKAQGLMIEHKQNALMLDAQTKLLNLSKEYKTEFRAPVRIGMGPCDLPGLLYIRNKKIFFLQRNIKNETGGAMGLNTFNDEIKWHFEDKRVQQL
jgi:hypothetical protein